MATNNTMTAAPMPPTDGKWVYVPYFRHWRTGKLVYPKRTRFFRFPRRKR